MLYSPALTAMWHVLHLIARPFEALVGVFCLVTAGLLYPKEDGTIQSKLEDFWIRVDDFQNLALTRHAAFMTQIAKLETSILDRIFGHSLLSYRAFFASWWCSLISIWLITVPFVYHTIRFKRALIIYFIFTFVVSIMFIKHSKKYPRYAEDEGGYEVALVMLTTLSVFMPVTGLSSIGAILGSLFCDVFFIAVTRALLRWVGTMKSSLKVLFAVAANIALGLLLVSPVFWGYGRPLKEMVGSNIFTVGASNVLDALLAWFFVVLAATLVLHRLLWPLLTRTLFRLQETGTKGRRGILIAVGCSLLGTSVFGGEFPKLWEKILEKFGG
jgi:hypothetical protein